jgi:zinc protease
MLFGDHPYGMPLYGTAESVARFETGSLLEAFTRHRDSGPWVLAVAGSRPVDEVVRLLERALAGFTPVAARRRFATGALAGNGSAKHGHERLTKDREQTHIVYGFRALSWGDPDRAALDVLINVLGGHGGRLSKELRDKESLAYTVSPLVAYGADGGLVGSYIACAPAKAERARAALEQEMLALTEKAPAAGEVERARSHIIGTHDMSLQRSDSQTSTMALMELYEYGYDDFLTYPEAIARVSAADVQRVARRLLVPAQSASVVVGPE